MIRAFAHSRQVVGSILHGGHIELFLVPVSAPRWCNKDRGMCYSVCESVHIKYPLLLIEKSSPCGGSGFSLSLSDYLNGSLPYIRRHINVNKMY